MHSVGRSQRNVIRSEDWAETSGGFAVRPASAVRWGVQGRRLQAVRLGSFSNHRPPVAPVERGLVAPEFLERLRLPLVALILLYHVTAHSSVINPTQTGFERVV
jgi:hypothetical protein